MVPCEKSKMISFACSIVKSISVFPSRSIFPVTLTCCIAFGSALSACCLLKPIVISLQCSVK